LGVPAACSAGTGRFESAVPNGHASLLAMLPAAPWLAGYLAQADRMKMAANLADTCRVVAADGKTLAQLPQAQGESFTVAEVALPHKKQPPLAAQPGQKAPWVSYLISDKILPRVVRPIYRKGVERLRTTV